MKRLTPAQMAQALREILARVFDGVLARNPALVASV